MARFIKRNLEKLDIKINYISNEKLDNIIKTKHQDMDAFELLNYIDIREVRRNKKTCNHFGSILLGFLELKDLNEPTLLEVLFCKKCKNIIFLYDNIFYDKNSVIDLRKLYNDNTEEIMEEIYKEEEK
jgi:hypothetical protein